MPTVTLSTGPLSYIETGSGPTLVFIHGYLVNHHLWRKVIPALSGEFRCIAPTLPLGAHEQAVSPAVELTPLSVAALIAEFIQALDLHDVTLIGNDTGGAICQLVVTRHPERIGALVLTNCDAFENFFPPLLRPLQWGLAVPGFTELLIQALRLTVMQRLLIVPVAHRFPEAEVRRTYFEPSRRSRAVAHDLRRFGRSVNNRYTREAAQQFSQVRIPVLIVWGRDDFIFPPRYGERLKRAFPNARLEWVAHSRAFVSEDQPAELVRLIRDFLDTPQPVGASGSAARAQAGAQS